MGAILCFPACSPGRFGPFCTQTCSCPANLICDRFTGDCVCESGGDDCKQGIDANSINIGAYTCFADCLYINLFLRKFVFIPFGNSVASMSVLVPSQRWKVNESCFSCCTWFLRLVWAVRERHGSSSSWWKGVLGSHWGHRRARHPGGFAAGSAAALPPQAEGQTEQHADRLLLHQPHGQLWIRRSRYSISMRSYSLSSDVEKKSMKRSYSVRGRPLH